MRKKIVPPVTPKIIQSHPRQQRVRYALLFLAFLLTAWLGYDYGKSRAPAEHGVPVSQSSGSHQQITMLKRERDTLRQQVTELERSVRQANKALVVARTGNPEPRQPVSSPREAPAPQPAAATVVADSADDTLLLQNIRLDKTGAENAFRIGFSVLRAGDSTDRVIGTIWIAVNGFIGKEPRRLSFNTLSSDNRSYVKMGFDQQQDVTEEIVLPDDFRPKNIMIEAKPYGETYTGASGKVAWNPTG